jgi:CDP-paratose synthetase
MKLLITGATGFIGKNICQRLIQEKINFSCIVRENSNKKFLLFNKISYFIFDGDIKNLVKYMNFEEFTGVIHLASLYLTQHKKDQVEDLILSNILFGTKILEASMHAKIPWFLNTGTCWQHYQGEDYNPVNLYAASKQGFESIARYYAEACDINFITIKLNDTYGLGDTRKKIFNLWRQSSKTGEQLLMSPGDQLIDIVHIDTVVDKYLKLINLLPSSHAQYNLTSFVISSNKEISLKQLAKEYELKNKVKLNIIWGGAPYRDREVMTPKCKGYKL